MIVYGNPDKVGNRLKLLLWVSMILSVVPGCGIAQVGPPSITVAVDGHTITDLASLQEAVKVARDQRRTGPHGPIVIQLPSGTIHLAAPIALSQADAGTAAAPLVIRGQPDGSSVISGARPIGTVAGDELRVLLATALPQRHLTPLAALTENSDPETRLFLFEGGRRLALSSWPVIGYATGWSIKPEGTDLRLTRSTGKIPAGSQIVVDGFLFADWQHKAFDARSDSSGVTIATAPKDMPPQSSARLRLLNVGGPLSIGRYTLENGNLRVRGFTAGATIDVATASSLFTLDHADNVRFETLALEKTTGTAIKITQSDAVSLRDCYLGLTGGYAVEADGGHDVSIQNCVVTHTGMGGFRLNGGERVSLTPARHSVTNSAILGFGDYIRSYSPAIALTGVGNIASHNLIASAPHAGIILSGNDHRVDGNELHHLACETNDASAIYMGRDWTQRGNRITGNFIHDISSGSRDSTVSGVYLDDQFSGTEIAGNVFARMPHGVFLGGGRDNLIHDNIFVNMIRSAIWIDDRGLSWQSKETAPGGVFRQSLEQSPYLTPAWRLRYPRLANLLADRPGTPVGNEADRNITIGSVFLWASPMTLALDGIGNINRELPSGKPNSLNTMDPLNAIYRLAAKLAPSTKPGPTKRLLYRSRIGDLGGC